MTIKGVVSLSVALLLSVGCATDGTKSSLTPAETIVLADTLAQPFTGDTTKSSTASDGDILFEQTMTVEHSVRLISDLQIQSRGIVPIRVEVSSETQLYPVTSSEYGQFFCVRLPREISQFEKFMSGKSQMFSRDCFRDIDGNMTFDEFWRSDEDDPATTYSSLYIMRTPLVQPRTPVPYTDYDQSGITADRIGVQYFVDADSLDQKTLNLETVVLDKTGNIVQRSRLEKSFEIAEAVFPVTIDYFGSAIEIISYDNEMDEIHYRILSGFKTGQPVFLASERRRVSTVIWVYY